ncbi:hypothetical protein GUJ93_ZPchr0005g14664 [Zizania palustris]|uniref:Uncharacterized protein n=1 Tax=Zizania palustris TaxID=103762 RepID=A0A8J5SEX5_ZIZPA|nr:hypothetical protein GUJ93_ZPchr0005g14664 [Zizania palustris]
MHYEYKECVRDCDEAVERGRELRADNKLVARALSREASALLKLATCAADYDPAIRALQQSLAEHYSDETLAKLEEAEGSRKGIKEKERLDQEAADHHHDRGFGLPTASVAGRPLGLMEALSLIYVAAEDDILLDLASPPQLHRDPPKSGYPVGAASDPEAGQVVDPCGATEQLHEQSESPKQRKGKAGVNLRKSMAWDNAFFTSEGVLDTEELAVANSTFRKARCSRLPGISEELRRSGESTDSTIESESWVLESLQTELFDNVRASIQRSLSKPEKAPCVTAATTKLPKSATIVHRVAAKKGADLMPKTRPPISTSHGVVGGKQRPQTTLKEPGAARVALPGSTEAKPSLKPMRALPRVATMREPTNTTMASGISIKRSSTGGVVNKQAAGKSANIAASMHSQPAGVMKSSSTSKSCALASTATATSIDNIPGPKAKSSILSNKNRTAQRIPIRSSSRTDINKVNPARALKNKIPSRGHSDRAPPSISPNSYLDSMSSVLSGASAASTVGKMSHTSESFSTVFFIVPFT